MPTAVLATKLFAPALRSQAVARTRLRERLDATLDPGQQLTLVSAPAGFGKTTVLSDWVARLAEHDPQARAAWLSLDEGDNDLGRLLSHLMAALAGAGVDLDSAAVLEHLPGDPTAAMTSVINAVAIAGEHAPDTRWVLVLDDYHLMTAPEAHEATSFLLDHLPDQLRLMMATRADPPFALSRLRSRGQLVEVRGADLRFTAGEAQQFLNEAMRLDLDTADVAALEGRTEGWIAGLQLAALSLRAIPTRLEVTDFIEAFTGSNRFVLDYLADEVLTRQPAAVRDFLLRTSVLDRFTGSLCDTVSGQPGGAAMLADLERANLFLVPLDSERSWYRYHHLFADVLHARLLTENPNLVPQLHRRASDWYAERGLAGDAIRHALVAEDFPRAAYLVEEALSEVRRARQDSQLLAWIHALPDPVVRPSPVLNIVAGWARMLTGDLNGLEARLDDADAALAAGRHDPELAATWADTDDLRTAAATVLVYRASLAQARGDVAATVRHAREALALAGPEDHFVRGGAAGFLGLAAWAAGDVEEALATFSEAVRSLHAAGNLVDELDATVNLADMWVAAGRPSRARTLYEKALEMATGNGEPYPRATADLHVGLAELGREVDDLTSAETHLETARILAERGSITENRHRWPMAMAQVRAARGDHEAATRLLEEAASLYRHGFYPDLRPIAAMQARLQITTGDLETAAAWARERGPGVEDDPDYLHEYEHLTLVRLLLAQFRAGRSSDRRATVPALTGAVRLLDRLHDAADAAQRDGSLLELRVLRALAHHAVGEIDAALTVLSQVLRATPEPESHVRLYLDEGAPMLDLLRDAAQSRVTVEQLSDRDDEEEQEDEEDQQEVLRVWAREMLERTGAAAEEPALQQPADPLVDPLSQREVEVLRLLDSELSGPQIADALYVSLNTLRTHTKRIFTKLDVKSRAAAVRTAHDRGLI
ncbi:MAG: helix-turn-helix transcriptional regulator [Marmoricola sp.]|nr:helix-turn-helix transcriptional regulator [Marmoricola sp.]